MQANISIGGFGVSQCNQMRRFLDIADGSVTSLGSSDVTNIFTQVVGCGYPTALQNQA